MRQSRLPVLLAAMLAAMLLVPASAQAANVGGRPAPAVWDVLPRPGEVVPSGDVLVSATSVHDGGVSNVRLFIDGLLTEAPIADENDVAVRISTTVDFAPGPHQIDIVFTANGVGDVQRSWFTLASGVKIDRLAGADRVATAADIARNGREPNAAPAAVIARSDQFADALAGAPLAVALEGPLLLTTSDELAPAAADALRDLLAPNARVTLLGGKVALDDAVVTAIEALGFRTRRIAGDSRYDTAGLIADELPDSDAAIVVSGVSFPDALAVAAPAAVAGTPILLTDPSELSGPTAERVGGKSVTIIGGPSAVSADVQAALDDQADTVRRIGGETRYDTAANVVRAYLSDEPGTTIAVASGQNFADALAGAVDAATSGAPLVLSHPTLPTPATTSLIADLAPTNLRVYGGTVAVSDGGVAALQAGMTDKAPALVSSLPGAGEEVPTLDKISLNFDDVVDVGASALAVYFDDRELPISFESGDFDDTIVVTVGDFPAQPARNQIFDVRVMGRVTVGGEVRHFDQSFTYRKTALAQGDSGDDVLALQNRLKSLGYWIGEPDASYGTLTTQAVMAFQKVERLTTSGVADAAMQTRLASAIRPRPASTSGNLTEIDKTRQVIFIVRGGNVLWTINTSTGTEKPYTYEGTKALADTPTGVFTINRQIDGERVGDLGRLWRPKYFHPDGIAIHGSPSIPNYPASHGCARMTDAAINFIWEQNLAPLGSTMWVYGRFPGT